MHGDIPGCQLHRKMLSARSRFRPSVEAGTKQHRAKQCYSWSRRILFRCASPSPREALSAQDAAAVWKQFEADERSGLWHWLAVTENVVRRACITFEKLEPTVFLRASDALHLACAAENQFSAVYSGDQILLEAAPFFGLEGLNVY